MTDREPKWKANEAELNRIYSLSPLAREQFAKRIDQLEAEQEAAEWEAGREDVPPGSVRYSGMP